jgi:hypothetical protein
MILSFSMPDFKTGDALATYLWKIEFFLEEVSSKIRRIKRRVFSDKSQLSFTPN